MNCLFTHGYFFHPSLTECVRDFWYTEHSFALWQQRRAALKFDRLLALVFLLQRHPHLTARELGERFLPSYPVTLRISPDAVPRLLQFFGEALSDHLLRSKPDASGWRTVSLVFETMETARTALLGFGPTAEVVAPRALRASVMEWGFSLLAHYRNEPQNQIHPISTDEIES